MKETDFVNFSNLWRGAMVPYNRPVDDFQVDLMFEMLKEYEFSQIAKAVTAHMKNPDSGQFAPKPADIVRHIQGGSKDRALMAWTKVESAMRRVGIYDSIVFDDEWIMSIIADMGGWIKLCASSDDELPFLRTEFVSRYTPTIGKRCDHFQRRLCGKTEHANGPDYPHRIPKPQMFGDVNKCLEIYNLGIEGPAIQITRMEDIVKKTPLLHVVK